MRADLSHIERYAMPAARAEQLGYEPRETAEGWAWHLWRCQTEAQPVPPTIMVGVRNAGVLTP